MLYIAVCVFGRPTLYGWGYVGDSSRGGKTTYLAEIFMLDGMWAIYMRWYLPSAPSRPSARVRAAQPTRLLHHLHVCAPCSLRAFSTICTCARRAAYAPSPPSARARRAAYAPSPPSARARRAAYHPRLLHHLRVRAVEFRFHIKREVVHRLERLPHLLVHLAQLYVHVPHGSGGGVHVLGLCLVFGRNSQTRPDEVLVVYYRLEKSRRGNR